MTDRDVDAAVSIVRAMADAGEQRSHAALASDDDRLYNWLLLYEMRCVEAAVRLVRVFPQLDDAERWLAIVSAARELQ